MKRVLVVDDAQQIREGFAQALRAHFDVASAATVAEALSYLVGRRPDAVVLDLSLDESVAPLHSALADLGVPVLLVSGADPGSLPSIATEHGWRHVVKPVDVEVLVGAVDQLLARSTPPPEQPLPRPSRAPAPPPRNETPARGSSRPPDATPSTWPAALSSTVDMLTRRALRGIVAWLIYRLQSGGHGSAEAVVGLVVCAVGIDAAMQLYQRSRGAAAAAVALPVLLALAGEATGSRELVDAGAYVAGIGSVAITRLSSLRA